MSREPHLPEAFDGLDAAGRAPLSMASHSYDPWGVAQELDEELPIGNHRKVLWSILGLVIAAMAWAYIGEIDVVATAPGKVIPDGRVKVVQAAENAVVRALHTHEGQMVNEGDLLVELDPTVHKAEHDTTIEKLGLAKLDLERLQAELDNRPPQFDNEALPEWLELQHAMLAAKRSAHAAKVAEARSEWQQRRMREASAHATLGKLEKTVQTAREQEERVRPYVGEVMPRFDYQRLKDGLSVQEGDLTAQRSSVEAAKEDRIATEQRLKMIEQERRSALIAQINEKRALVAVLNSEQVKAGRLLSQKELRAPTTGQVQSLSVTTPGGVVTPAQVIATVVPLDAKLMVEAVLSNTDIGYVRVGQKVDLKIDTFPFQKYGTVPGTVTWISPDAEARAPGSTDPTELQVGSDSLKVPSKSGLMYRLRIKPDQPGVFVENELRQLSAGMTVQADIVTSNRRIYEFFLAPVIKHWNDGMKVR